MKKCPETTNNKKRLKWFFSLQKMTSIVSETPNDSAPESKEVKYATIMETSGEECESWYYFVKYNGNEKNLQYLKQQIDQIEMYIIDDLSTFDIELEHLVSEKTAKEMSKLEINSVMFHRKFDGKLKTINLGLKKKDSNEKRIERINTKLALGQIVDYVSDEDIDSEDLQSSSEETSESEHEDDEDLIPLPFNEESSASTSLNHLSLNDGHEAVGKEQPKKKKKKKKKNRN